MYKIIKDYEKASYTKISFIPEYTRFGYKNLTSDINGRVVTF